MVCKITKYEISVQIGLQGLLGWCAVRTIHFDSGYDITIATYSLPDLYLPKMKTALFVAPEFNRLSCACARSSQFSSTRASLSEKCSLLGTDNVRGQISEHIFAPNEGYCLYNPVNTPFMWFPGANLFYKWEKISVCCRDLVSGVCCFWSSNNPLQNVLSKFFLACGSTSNGIYI